MIVIKAKATVDAPWKYVFIRHAHIVLICISIVCVRDLHTYFGVGLLCCTLKEDISYLLPT